MPRNFKKGKTSPVSSKPGMNKEVPSFDTKPGNDIQYWNKYPDLLDNAAKVAWNHIAGTPLNLKSGRFAYNLPNVMVINYVFTPGYSKSTTDAFNLQVRKTWLQMHRKFRGIGGYDQADLGIALFSIIALFAEIADLERVYGLLHAYPVNNRVVPRSVLRALGLSNGCIQSIESNLADFRYGINRLILKSRQLCLPKGLTVLPEQIGMRAFVYKDSTDERASIYAFKHIGQWRYVATALSTGGAVSNFGGSIYFANDYENMLSTTETTLDLLLNDSDIARMCSDLIACYGNNGVEGLVSMPEDYAVVPQYDESMLHKIHNLETVRRGAQYFLDKTMLVAAPSTITAGTDAETYRSASSATGDYDVYLWIDQLNNVIHFEPYLVLKATQNADTTITRYDAGSESVYLSSSQPNFEGSACGCYDLHIIDSWKSAPTMVENCEGNLWRVIGKTTKYTNISGISNASVMNVTDFGPEIILSFDIFTALRGDVWSTVYHFSTQVTSAFTSTAAIAALNKFDWHPLIYVFSGPGATYSTDPNPECIIGDLDNFTTVSENTITRINDIATMSTFTIPDVPNSGGNGV